MSKIKFDNYGSNLSKQNYFYFIRKYFSDKDNLILKSNDIYL